jgi:hypothetical protein
VVGALLSAGASLSAFLLVPSVPMEAARRKQQPPENC